jgi:single-strand DNA-binding protein
MAGETSLTVVGNLTGDPEIRYTQAGVAVANFTIASTPRSFDKQSNEWKDGEALFMRCTAWRDLAEHVSSSLSKGSRVIAQGNLVPKSWEDRNGGGKRTSLELDVQEIGPSLRYAIASVQRAPQPGQGQPQPQGQSGWAADDDTPF